MKQFEEPKFEIVSFDDNDDIVCSSNCEITTIGDAVICVVDNCRLLTGKVDCFD